MGVGGGDGEKWGKGRGGGRNGGGEAGKQEGGENVISTVSSASVAYTFRWDSANYRKEKNGTTS